VNGERQAAEQAGWEALAEANERAALRLAQGDVPEAPTPEALLAAQQATRHDG
jgi:hypothetical protein